MEMRQLKYFVAIADAMHFGKAAKTLFVSQPALSQQIQLLEQELGVALFVDVQRKQYHRVELTKAGNVFLEEARRILQLADHAIDTARRVSQGQQIIRIGTYKMLIRERIVELIQIISTEVPDIQIKIVEFNTFEDVQLALLNDTINLGVTVLPTTSPELSSQLILENYLDVILPSTHHLATQTSIKIGDLSNEKWIEIEKPLSPFSSNINKLCLDAGFDRESNIVMSVTSFDMMQSMVALGKGVAFVLTSVDTGKTPEIVCKKLTDNAGQAFTAFSMQQGVAWKTNNQPPIIANICHALRAYYNT